MDTYNSADVHVLKTVMSIEKEIGVHERGGIPYLINT
jgi:hypothetical protein